MFWDWFMGRDEKTTVSIEKTGSLYFLINAFLGAYNRRTDVIARGTSGGGTGEVENKIDRLSVEIGTLSAQTRLILDTLEGVDQTKIDELTNEVKTEADALEGAAEKGNQ